MDRRAVRLLLVLLGLLWASGLWERVGVGPGGLHLWRRDWALAAKLYWPWSWTATRPRRRRVGAVEFVVLPCGLVSYRVAPRRRLRIEEV